MCLFNLCGSTAERPKTDRYIRPFNISSVAHVKLASDARLLKDQSLECTCKGKNKINQEKVPLGALQAHVETLEPDLMQRTYNDRNNTQTTKIIQNLYVTSFGGLKAKTLKHHKVNLLLNATIDLPNVEVNGVENIRVPITELEPDTLTLYANDVADKIHENYLKNGQTVIYCHDGNLNSMAVSTVYLLKYTDLFLSEALLHLQYTRKGFELSGGDLATFKKPVELFAKKLKKYDLPPGDGSNQNSKSASANATTSTSKKGKGKSKKCTSSSAN